MTVTW